MIEVYRIGVKFFAVDSAAVALRDFVPVFHRWIQKQIVKDHLLLDVHDYSHIHHGPGILLVGHEGNFSIDMAEGRMGLLYYRKQPLAGTPEQRLTTVVRTALEGCRILEDDSALAGKIRFRQDEALVVANDRLLAPNDDQTFSEFQPILTNALARVLGPASLTLTAAGNDPKERFAVRVLCTPS